MFRFMVITLTSLVAAILSGCAGTASLSAIGAQAPGALAEIEQLKTAVVTAPLAGCVSVVQQASTLLNSLRMGTPAIPISVAPAPPILIVPPPASTTPIVASPTPVSVPPPTTSGTSPIVTPTP
jgi:hypothetical protein